ncbi:hypothetical protein RS030_213343 [Cryptosporidium xiaoi]|uniref:Uncharacterized protein n=1 Tax=Cryptosporidium xiaoi TaxID=659607 RepID=A0AAV9XXE8_9CRYT
MDQTLSPTSSEIMRRASVLVDKLLIKTGNKEFVSVFDASNRNISGNYDDSNDFFISKIESMVLNNEGNNCEFGNNSDKILNLESNSVTGSDAFSVLNSARKNVPSMDMIKKLAGRLKSRDSNAISELNFSEIRKNVLSGSNVVNKDNYYNKNNESISNYRSKSVSPVNNRYSRTTSNEFDHNFERVNESLNELNKRVENLSSNIDDIQDSECNEVINDSSGFPIRNHEDTNLPQNIVRGINGKINEDEYFNQMNVAFLQQERLRMWARDNAKYSTSISNSSESLNNNLETDHIPFSDICYSKKYLSNTNANDTSTSGIINSNVLSTTASGAVGQFAYSNDTTVYEFGSNGKNYVHDISKLNVKDNKQDFELEVTEKTGAGVSSSSNYYSTHKLRSFEPKTLRFIRVGNQLRRSITVTPLVESVQTMLSQKNRIVYSPGFQASKIERLANPHLSHNDFSLSSSNSGYSSNMVIITIKDNGENKKGKRNRGLNSKSGNYMYSEVDSDDSDEDSFFFSCRECSWNPVYSCSVQ